MKKYIFLFLVLFSISTWSQNKVKKETIFSDSYLRLGTIYPLQFGNHSFADAHDSNYGFAFSLYLLKYRDFRLGGGMEFLNYSIADKSKMGEIDNTNYRTYYFSICYDYKLNKKFIVQPNVGYGNVAVNFKSSNKEFTTQNGNEFRIGSYLDFRLNRSFAVFFAVHYISSTFEIYTNKEYKNYFGKAQQVQIGLGLKIY